MAITDNFAKPVTENLPQPPKDSVGEKINKFISSHGFGSGVGPGNPELAKAMPNGPFGDEILKLAPAIAGGSLTALLGPEAGYPAYAAVGGLTQGIARGGINKMQGKDFFNKETAIDTALGAGGGLATKPLGMLGDLLGKKLALAGIGSKAAPDAVELAKDIVAKKSVIGPQTQSSIEDLLSNEIEGNVASKNADAIANLLNKTPTRVLRANPSSGEMAEMQQEVIDLLRNIEPYGKAGKIGLGQMGNAFSQGVGNKLYDMVKEQLTKK